MPIEDPLEGWESGARICASCGHSRRAHRTPTDKDACLERGCLCRKFVDSADHVDAFRGDLGWEKMLEKEAGVQELDRMIMACRDCGHTRRSHLVTGADLSVGGVVDEDGKMRPTSASFIPGSERRGRCIGHGCVCLEFLEPLLEDPLGLCECSHGRMRHNRFGKCEADSCSCRTFKRAADQDDPGVKRGSRFGRTDEEYARKRTHQLLRGAIRRGRS